VFRTSFTNSQPTLALGKVMVDKGHKKAVWITWKYAAGDEAGEGFKEGYLADLLLVDGDPLTDVRILQNKDRLLAIMKDGKFHKAPRLNDQRRRLMV
jgi:hypothetical protein